MTLFAGLLADGEELLGARQAVEVRLRCGRIHELVADLTIEGPTDWFGEVGFWTRLSGGTLAARWHVDPMRLAAGETFTVTAGVLAAA